MPKLAELSVELALKGWDSIQEKLKSTKGTLEIVERGVNKLKEAGAGLSRNMSDDFSKLIAGAKSLKDSLVGAFDLKGWKAAIERFKADRVYFGTYDAIARRIGPLFEKAAAGAKKFAEASKYAFALGITGAIGFVRAGLQGTVQGELLNYRMQLLSREIASVFLPVVQKMTDYIGEAVSWFRSLNREQQDQIRRYTLIGLAVLGVVGTLPKLIAAARAGAAALQLLYANPILAGLALLAVALAGVGIAALRTKEAVDQLKAANAALKQTGQLSEGQEKRHGGLIEAVQSKVDKKTGKVIQRTPEEQKKLASDMLAEERQNLEELKARNRKRESGFGAAVNFALSGVGLTKNHFKEGKEAEQHSQERITILERLSKGEQLKQPQKKPRLEVTPVGGQWQQLGEAFRAGQSAVLQRGADPMMELGNKQLEAQKQIAENTGKIAGKPPPVA